MPIYGDSSTSSAPKAHAGENVGREWDYRSYIGGQHAASPSSRRSTPSGTFDDAARRPRQRRRAGPLRVHLRHLPPDQGRGEQGRLLHVHVRRRRPAPSTTSSKLDDEAQARARPAAATPRARSSGGRRRPAEASSSTIEAELLEKYGVYEVRPASRSTTTTRRRSTCPPRCSRSCASWRTSAAPSRASRPPPHAGRSSASIATAQPTQMLGVARCDFYLLAAERRFCVNFLKGVVGLWCLHHARAGRRRRPAAPTSAASSAGCARCSCSSPACSSTDIQQLAENRSVGGGPLEAAIAHRRPHAASPPRSTIRRPPAWSPASTRSTAGGCAAS